MFCFGLWSFFLGFSAACVSAVPLLLSLVVSIQDQWVVSRGDDGESPSLYHRTNTIHEATSITSYYHHAFANFSLN